MSGLVNRIPPPPGYTTCNVYRGNVQTTHLVALDDEGSNGGRPTVCGLTRFARHDPETWAEIEAPDLPGWSMGAGGVFGPDVAQVRCPGCFDVVTSRPRDEHGRILWRNNEVPEVGSGFGIWRGLVVTPDLPYGGNSVSGCHADRPYAVCTDGWVASGDWWLHCSDCHPYTVEQDVAMKCRKGFHKGCGCLPARRGGGMTPRQVLASWSGWGTTTHGDTVADDIIATLAAHGYVIVGEGQAVIGGEVVTLQEVRGRGGSVQPIAYRRGKWVLGNESDAWMDQRTAFVIEVPS